VQRERELGIVTIADEAAGEAEEAEEAQDSE
jgi:hypothetical protein